MDAAYNMCVYVYVAYALSPALLFFSPATSSKRKRTLLGSREAELTACVRACVRACMYVWVCVCVCVQLDLNQQSTAAPNKKRAPLFARPTAAATHRDAYR